MEVTSPTFVLIHNAQRDFLCGDSQIPKVWIEKRPYARGELGLIHPEVIKSFSREFVPREPKNDREQRLSQGFFQGFVREIYHSVQESIVTYVPDFGEIPVVLYDERQNVNYSAESVLGQRELRRRNPGYFIAPFYPTEFQVLVEKKFGTISKELRYFPKRDQCNREETRETVTWLKLLHHLMHGAYDLLPIEVTKRKREQREVEEFLAQHQR